MTDTPSGEPDFRVSRAFEPRLVTELYAYIATETNGGEGVAACLMPVNGVPVMMPLVGADIARVQSLKPYADLVQEKLGRPVTLRRFIAVLTPDD